MRVLVISAAFLGFLALPLEARGQSSGIAWCGPGMAISAECAKDFQAWQEAEKKWREHKSIWSNYAAYLGQRVKIMRRPEPPIWLEAHCKDLIETGQTALSFVCGPYRDYLNYDWLAHIVGPRTQIVYSNTRIVQSGPESSSLWEFLLRNLHYDGFWTNSSSGPRYYGSFGTHLTLAHAGRIYFWGPPGLLVLREPSGRIRLAATWGVDIRIADVQIPFFGKRPLYLGLAKAFRQGESLDILNNPNSGLDIIGLSFTVKR